MNEECITVGKMNQRNMIEDERYTSNKISIDD